MTISIPLGYGYVAIIDDADYPLVSGYSWGVIVQDHANYARTHIQQHGKRVRVLMHNLIQPTATGMIVDHRNGDGLDNRRSNLRASTHQQNCANRRRRTDSRWPYKGIRQLPGSGRWGAFITVTGKKHSLGTHDTADEAARAYDKAARRYFGDFAKTNF